MEKKGYLSIIVFLFFLGAAVYFGYSWYKDKTSPSTETVELTEYYKVAADEILVFENGCQTKERLPYIDGHVYLHLEMVRKLNGRYYWDKTIKSLIFTTESDIQIIKPEDDFYTSQNGFIEGEEKDSDGVIVSVGYPIVKIIEDSYYIALDFVKDNIDLSYEIYTNPNRIVLRYEWKEYLFAKTTQATQLRSDGSIKSSVLRELPAGTELELTDSAGTNRNGFLYAVTSDGVKAWVDEKCISETYFKEIQSPYVEKEYSHLTLPGKINLVWDLTVSADSNKKFKDRMKKVTGLNVVSPTWFNIKDDDGNIESRATADYVKEAHNMGLQVWALVSDFHPANNSLKINELEILKSREKRANIIKQLTDAADKYGFDGINIDFEKVPKDAGIHYVQFLRELSVACRHENLYLSIDDTVPFSFNAYYDVAEQGKIADYVIIMAYDEHYDGSEAGSVASLTYVQTALDNTLAKAPKERVVIAMPFYTRIWKVTTLTDGNVRTYSEAMSMTEAAKYLKNHAEIKYSRFDEDAGQDYYTGNSGDIEYKVWMEDLVSLEGKCAKIFGADVAGVAAWRLGQEDSGIWAVIEKYLNAKNVE